MHARIRKFFNLSWAERFLLLEAFLSLGIARAALLLIPFKTIAPRLGMQSIDPPKVTDTNTPPEWARRIAWAIETTARYTPWKSACLAQAIAGNFLLKRRGLDTCLYLGVRKDIKGEFSAHAWLKAGPEILIGANGHETFTVLSVFSSQ